MPISPQRTRTLRRVRKKTPKGKIVTHYIQRRPSKSKCAVCKNPLLGMPNLVPHKLKKLSKTQRRPERPYGGYLCPACLKKKILLENKNLKNEKIEVGRLVVKLAGREAGKVAVVLEVLNSSFVILDGQVKKRKCNINHIATLNQKIKITKSATKEELKKEFKKLGYDLSIKKSKPKKEKPKKVRKVKKSPEAKEKPKPKPKKGNKKK